jgi:Cysteinyl-tRNA synthetase
VECSIIPYIQRIMDQGMAYRIDHDGVYFDVGKFEDTTMEMYGGKRNRYGKLAVSSGRMETLFSWGNNAMTNHEERKSPKKDPRDFVLWKNRGGNDGSSSASDGKDNDYEQQDMLWDSPWGKGRPGWHIECSAMIESTMQLDFMRDHYKLHVHAGGIDLKFPHHTNEIAQAEAYHSRRSKSRTRVRDGKENDNCYNQDGDWEEGEEWIPHWIHTGHLHIDGLKMSKSLKNFITIRELLEEGRNDSSSDGDDGGGGGVGASFNRLHSPADDFRLWCLGLSGSYRGPATYSKSRLMEARVVREKIVRFLVDGEQWIKGMESSCSSLSKFTAREFDLMQQTNKCQMTCLQLIFGMERNLDSHHQSEQFDFDGSAYLNALIELSDAGNKYIAANIMTRGESSTVAVVQALTVLRECLSIVGFSDKTVRAGKSDYVGNDSHEQQHNQNSTGVVQELVSFRKAVRELALEQVKRCGQSENASDMPNNVDIGKDLLTLCDKLRDEDLPKVGIEIFDSVGQDILSDWRFIIPRDEMNGDDNKDSTDSSKQLSRGPEIITESNFFKVGRYEGQFSAFDANDFPTLDANGMELSKRMAKKLLKKKTSYFEKKKK